eukprot:6648334-Pyramimonas_sp.AAC.1
MRVTGRKRDLIGIGHACDVQPHRIVSMRGKDPISLGSHFRVLFRVRWAIEPTQGWTDEATMQGYTWEGYPSLLSASTGA